MNLSTEYYGSTRLMDRSRSPSPLNLRPRAATALPSILGPASPSHRRSRTFPRMPPPSSLELALAAAAAAAAGADFPPALHERSQTLQPLSQALPLPLSLPQPLPPSQQQPMPLQLPPPPPAGIVLIGPGDHADEMPHVTPSPTVTRAMSKSPSAINFPRLSASPTRRNPTSVAASAAARAFASRRPPSSSYPPTDARLLAHPAYRDYAPLAPSTVQPGLYTAQGVSMAGIGQCSPLLPCQQPQPPSLTAFSRMAERQTGGGLEEGEWC